jgi:hypothetical protein
VLLDTGMKGFYDISNRNIVLLKKIYSKNYFNGIGLKTSAYLVIQDSEQLKFSTRNENQIHYF